MKHLCMCAYCMLLYLICYRGSPHGAADIVSLCNHNYDVKLKDFDFGLSIVHSCLCVVICSCYGSAMDTALHTEVIIP